MLILKRLREQKKMTQAELGKILKISPSAIGMYEHGRREPDIPTLKKMASFFNVSIDYLLGYDNKTTAPLNDLNKFLLQSRIIFDGNNRNLSDKDKDILEQSLKIAFMAIEKQREGGNNGNEESH